MKKIMLFFLLISCLSLSAQMQTIQGRLTDWRGNPVARGEFSVVNRNIQGTTDVNGYFVLSNVTANDVILVRNSGRRHYVWEVTVSVLSITEAPVASAQILSRSNAAGVIFLQPDGNIIPYFGGLDRITYIGTNRIEQTNQTIRTYGFGNFTTFVEAGTVGRLPRLQSRYGQSESGSFINGLPSEMFSWGEPISGRAYDATDFFRTGISFGNMVDVKIPSLIGREHIAIGLGQRRNNNPIPGAYSNAYNASLIVSNIRTGRFNSSAGVLYRHSYNNLPQHGSNLSSLLYSVLTTPPSFNNRADRNQGYSDFVPNPFRHIHFLSDRDRSNNLLAYARTNFRHQDFSGNASFSFDRQWNERTNGMPFPFHYLTVDRREDISNLTATADFSYRINRNISITPLAYGFRRTTHNLEVQIPLNAMFNRDYELARNAHDIRYSIRFDSRNRAFFLELENSHYFSNTLSTSTYTNFFPGANFDWRMDDVLDIVLDELFFSRFDGNFHLRGSWRRSISEMPLIYRNNAVLSTGMSASMFRHYFEDWDFVFDETRNLNAEIFTKANIGFRYSVNPHNRRNNISIDFNYFNNRTNDFILPVAHPVGFWYRFQLENAGAVRNSGFEIGLSHRGRIDEVSFNTHLSFTRAQYRVISVNDNMPDMIRLAGFWDIATVFAENQTLGAIYGTTFLRDAQGEFVLDADGFRAVNHELTKIGDPTPDFVMALSSNIGWRNFELSLAMEYSHGGQRWNGTRAYLDFLGMSENSAVNRNALTMENFTRFGATGVGEDYIEDATFFRLADIGLSYNFNMRYNRFFHGIRVGFSARNLLLLTSYQGVDPSTRLFGYSAGAGLDLFNVPSLRTYSLAVSVRF